MGFPGLLSGTILWYWSGALVVFVYDVVAVCVCVLILSVTTGWNGVIVVIAPTLSLATVLFLWVYRVFISFVVACQPCAYCPSSLSTAVHSVFV